jgi:hypothetical protein
MNPTLTPLAQFVCLLCPALLMCCSVPNQELAQLLPFMHKTFGASYFLLGADRAWPHKMFEAAEPLISRLGGRVVGKEFTTGKETDFAPLIGKVGATKAKILVFALKGDGLHFISGRARRALSRYRVAVALPRVPLGLRGLRRTGRRR